MVRASVLTLCLLSAAHAARQRTQLSEYLASTIAADASSNSSQQEMHLVANAADAETMRSTPSNYLMAVLCTALAYFMNLEARTKSANPNDHPAEDAAIGVDDERKRKYTERILAQGGVDRWTRIALNQGENFPFHMWVLWGALMAGGKADSVAVCFVAYMTFRVLFVFCYIYSLSPWRTLVFLGSQASIVTASYLGISGAMSTTDSTYRSFRIAATVITNFFFLMNFIARFKSIDPNNHPAEDAAIGLSDEQRQAFKEARERDGPNRWERIATNQAEMIPVSFAVYWGAYGVGTNPATLMYLFVSYAVLRVLFVICYVFSLQPFRSMSWMFSNIVTMVAGVMGIIAASGEELPQLLMAISTLLVFFLNLVGLFRAVDPNNHPAEDAMIGVDDSRKEAYAKRLEDQGGVDRWTRVSANQLENFPVHIVALWGAASISGNAIDVPRASTIGAIGFCFAGYAAFRLLFVVCYLNALTPWRSIMFGCSQVCVFAAFIIAALNAKAVQSDGPWLPMSA